MKFTTWCCDGPREDHCDWIGVQHNDAITKRLCPTTIKHHWREVITETPR